MSPSSANGRLWHVVDELVDRAPRLSDLRSHKLELFAARRWREFGRPVPEELAEAERLARVTALAAPRLLARIREVIDGPVVLLKGPEVAAWYADPSLRSYKDIDVLVPDADAAWRALAAAGFEPIGDPAAYVGIHHLRPLALRGLPLSVEVHARPKWVDRLPPPPTAALIEAAVPSRVAGDGILTLPPSHQAVVLAAHSWAHEPLRALRDVVDIAAVDAHADRRDTEEVARELGVDRMWRSTAAAVDALFADRRTPLPLRLWAQNLPRVRERTVFENHAQRWLSNLWALSPRHALAAMAATAVGEIGPSPDETWRQKLARTARAVRNARARRSDHERRV